MNSTCLSPEGAHSNSNLASLLTGFRRQPKPQELGDPGGVVDATGPGAAARILEGSPQVGVGRDVGIRYQAGVKGTRGQLRRRHGNGLDGAFQFAGIDAQTDEVAIPQPADRAAGPGLGAHVADAGAGGNAGKATIGDQGDALAVLNVFEGGSDLVGLRHATARTDAGEYHDIAGFDRA